MALRVIVQSQYAQNLLAAPVPAREQVYVGQRQFTSSMIQPILTIDLAKLRLQKSHLYIGGVWNWSSWSRANPKAFKLWDLYLYKCVRRRPRRDESRLLLARPRVRRPFRRRLNGQRSLWRIRRSAV